MRGTDSFRTAAVFLFAGVIIGLAWGPETGRAQNVLFPANTRPVAVLSQLDIDGNGVPDSVLDSDGDGLPDNWEVGGFQSAGVAEFPDRLVNFPAPTAIGPGTPPTFAFSRLAVATRADLADTDGDGLSDFIEVFGLKYIDDNRNGILDADEWADLNGDGLPSIGEYPLANIDPQLNRDHDFDGFMFTDPTLADTDGDGILDGDDRDPLINPQTFGVAIAKGFTRPGAEAQDADLDNDGLGNGSDFGNDIIQKVDFPTDINDLISIFRPDLENLRLLPESLLEDLIGADWNGDGLFRITDQRDFQLDVRVFEARLGSATFNDLFLVTGRKLYADNPALDYSQSPARVVRLPANQPYAARGVGMGAQLLLAPSGRTSFLPDPRIWTILYAWRMPGFDIDGDGYLGRPENASFELDDPQPLANTGNTAGIPQLDGQITPPNCGLFGGVAAALTLSGLLIMHLLAPWRRPGRC